MLAIAGFAAVGAIVSARPAAQSGRLDPVAAGSGTDPLADGIFVLVSLSLIAIPMAAGIAILRHRLYDIDLVINRTLVYGTLAAMLALASFGGVIVLGQLFAPLTRGSDLAIAGSTLAVPLSSGRCARASRPPSTGASTAVAMTPRARSSASAPACASR